jgi:hypothetical protein
MDTYFNKVVSAYTKKGYEFFDGNKPYNLNIFGIRKSTTVIDSFDDVLGIIYRNEKLQQICTTWKATTDPGKYWLLHPMNTKGAAILVPGQNLGAWKIGLHQGKYKALVQAKPVKGYRDGDLDNELDFDPQTIETGVFGINIHRSNPYTESYYIDKWSAGCQVFKILADYMTFMSIVDKSAALYGDSFTYTLFKEDELN